MSWSESRRVVITGLGLITPLGLNVKTTWDNLIAGKSALRSIQGFDTQGLSCTIAGEIAQDLDSGFNPEHYIPARDVKKMAKFIQYGIGAAQEAVYDSGIDFTLTQEQGVIAGVCMGSGIGGLGNIEDAAQALFKEKKQVSPFFIPSTLINLLAGQVSIKYKLTGPNIGVVTACTSGTHALGEAAQIIIRGDADIMIAGSAESSITPLGVRGFCACNALSSHFNNDPTKASRPWDKDRDGFVMSEGSGVVVLEEYEQAKKRGAKIYAEIAGYGLSGDGHHITSPHPEGKGARLCIERAIKNAKINYEDVDYINAHGTSTQLGDTIELGVVQNLFFEKNKSVLMSSTKSSLGHMLGAAGSVELILCALSMRDNIVPPTINLDSPPIEAKINLVPHVPVNAKLNYVLSNSFGFGGTNASVVLKRV
jgi:3-oxoacyl-[acyl-carrier-protein] synthase II